MLSWVFSLEACRIITNVMVVTNIMVLDFLYNSGTWYLKQTPKLISICSYPGMRIMRGMADRQGPCSGLHADDDEEESKNCKNSDT